MCLLCPLFWSWHFHSRYPKGKMKSPLSLSLLAKRPYAKKKERWNSPAHSAENQSIESNKKRPFLLLAPLRTIEAYRERNCFLWPNEKKTFSSLIRL